MFQAKFVEGIKTNFIYKNFVFHSLAVNEIMWKYMVECAGQATDNTIRCMRIAYRITKATDTHSEYGLLIDFPRQLYLSENASMLRKY